MLNLFFLFTVIPAIELYLLLQLGAMFGPFNTFALVVVTGIVGARLARREGVAVLSSLQSELAQGIPPTGRLVEGALVFGGGLLLVTPGILTDVAGLSMIFPLTRQLIAPALIEWAKKNVVVAGAGTDYSGHPSRPRQTPPSADTPPPFDHPVY